MRIRLLSAFLIAPISVPILIIALNAFGESGVYWEFYLKIGGFLGYGFAVLFGIPYYYLYVKHSKAVTVSTFVPFLLILTAVFIVVMGGLTVFQQGARGMISITFIGNAIIFFVATAVSLSVFYFIGFYRRR